MLHWFSILATLATAQPRPVAAVEDAPIANAPRRTATAQEALAALRAHDATIRGLVRGKASATERQSAVDALIDYHWLTQATLGGASRAPEICKQDCAEFEALLTALIRRNYMRLMDEVVDFPVKFKNAVAGRNEVFKVSTVVSVTKNGRVQTMGIDYVMHARNGTFIVRDIITDGVSLVRTYRYEFRSMIKQGGMARVLETLRAKLASAPAK